MFGFDYDEAAETVTIVHEGGASVEASRLTVEMDGEDGSIPFGENGETITAGSSVTVDVSGLARGNSVRVVWTGPDGLRQVIGRFTPN